MVLLALLLVPLALAVVAPDRPSGWMISGMVIAMFCYAIYRAMGTAAITPWLYQVVPEEVRGRYWATDQLLAAVGSRLGARRDGGLQVDHVAQPLVVGVLGGEAVDFRLHGGRGVICSTRSRMNWSRITLIRSREPAKRST